MNPYTQCALLSASTLRMLPHILLYLRFRKTIDADLEPYGEGKGGILTFIKVCTRQKVFRNLFYYRLGEYRSVFIKWLMPEDKSLHNVPVDRRRMPSRAFLFNLSQRRQHRPQLLLSAPSYARQRQGRTPHHWRQREHIYRFDGVRQGKNWQQRQDWRRHSYI